MKTFNFAEMLDTMTLEEMEARRVELSEDIIANDRTVELLIQSASITIPTRMIGDRLWMEDNQLKIAIKKLKGSL